MSVKVILPQYKVILHVEYLFKVLTKHALRKGLLFISDIKKVNLWLEIIFCED